jgi:hypothetical protein
LNLTIGLKFNDSGSIYYNNSVNFKRKHTGNIKNEFESIVEDIQINYEDFLLDLSIKRKFMEFVKIPRMQVFSILATCVIDLQTINSSYLNSLKSKEKNRKGSDFWDNPEKTYKTLWSLYEDLCTAIRDTHEAHQVKKFMKTFNFLPTQYGIV